MPPPADRRTPLEKARDAVLQGGGKPEIRENSINFLLGHDEGTVFLATCRWIKEHDMLHVALLASHLRFEISNGRSGRDFFTILNAVAGRSVDFHRIYLGKFGYMRMDCSSVYHTFLIESSRKTVDEIEDHMDCAAGFFHACTPLLELARKSDLPHEDVELFFRACESCLH